MHSSVINIFEPSLALKKASSGKTECSNLKADFRVDSDSEDLVTYTMRQGTCRTVGQKQEHTTVLPSHIS